MSDTQSQTPPAVAAAPQPQTPPATAGAAPAAPAASSRAPTLAELARSAAGSEGPPAADASSPPAPAPGDAPPWAKDIPAHLRGATAEETVDKLAKAYAGARTAMAQRGEVPADASAYLADWKPEGDVANYFGQLEADPFFKGLADDALKHGLSTAQYRGFVEGVLSRALSMDLISAPVSPETVLAALAPKTPGLSPEQARGEAARAIRDNEAYLQSLRGQAGIPAEALGLLDEMFGTVGGQQLIGLLRGGGKERAPVTGAAGGFTEADLDARIADPRNIWGSGSYDPKFAAETTRLGDRLAKRTA